MKKINWLFAAFFVISAATAQAQQKLLTINDIFSPQLSGRLTPLQWNKDGSLRQVKFGTSGAEVFRLNKSFLRSVIKKCPSASL